MSTTQSLMAVIAALCCGWSVAGAAEPDARARDEIDTLLAAVGPPARFRDLTPRFRVKPVRFRWTVFRKKTNRTVEISDEKRAIFDGDRMIGYIYDRNPVFANIRLFSMHPGHVADIDPVDWADATDFRNYARDYGESIVFGHVYDDTQTEIRGGGETIAFVRTDIGKPDGRTGRDVHEVNTVTLSLHPQLGYCLDRTRTWRCKPLPKNRRGDPITRIGVGDLWGWGVVNPWPREGTYRQGFFSHAASYRAGRGSARWAPDKPFTVYWMNGPTVEAIRHGWHPRVRHGGLVGYLDGHEGWGVAMSVVGPSDVHAAVCPAWGEFHASGADLPKGPDADGYWRLTVRHRVVGLPPEIQEHIRTNAAVLFEDAECLAIRLDGEDFEDQPLSFATPHRTVRFVGRGVKVTRERARSGRQSIVAQGRTSQALRELHLHQEHPPVCFDPNRTYRMACWVYVEGEDTEAFIIAANEIDAQLQEDGRLRDKLVFLREETVGKSRTVSVRKPGEWRQVTLEFTAPPYGGLLALGFVAIGPGKAYFDDFRIVKKPETGAQR